ncbi:MAG TPA: anhydro-N-acetylmuramic acid kinase [Chloroflexota bacterium]|jgi:anhydro-N-acetylmuramic acid kinase|nr:anhydro-N-acetylmuramic acid kinase [Chloroflexota bacterium]
MIVLGLMSGTSVDAVDAAVVEIGEQDDALVARVLGYHEQPIDEQLRSRVHAVFDPARSRVDEICELNVLLGEAFADVGAAALQRADTQADLVASHGQTVWHQVEPGRARSTLQLGEPSVLAERLGATVVADFRPRDIAAGGQGAPLASWADALLFGDASLARAVQNIGGIGNVTWVPPGGHWEAMLAFDTGPGNALIDHAASRLTGGAQRYDVDGALAASGRVADDLLAELLAMPYFRGLPPKSTGRELFGAQLVEPFIDRAQARGLRASDILATLTAFTAHSIADQYRRFLPGRPDEVVLGGGGSRNPVLVGLLAQLLDPARLRLHEEFGLPSLGREAVYFALMGYETLHGRPNTVPGCTGATHAVVMGKLLPGPNYRPLLERVLASSERRPTRLRIQA